jgi:hypothetical protein
VEALPDGKRVFHAAIVLTDGCVDGDAAILFGIP